MTFTVTDDDGGATSDTVTITVDNVAPQNVDAGEDDTVDEGDAVNLSGTFTDPGSADTHTYLWQVSADNGQVIADGTGQTFGFTPHDNGIYTVTFTVTDDDGGATSDTVTITVDNVAPQNVDAGEDDTVDEGDAVNLSGTYTDPGSADSHTYLWQVSADNGQVIADGTGQTFGFTPHDNGIYTVTFTVTDDDGGATSDTVTITVDNVAPRTSTPARTTPSTKATPST